MAYKVIANFKDLRDNGHEYKIGDVYPHTGKADNDRVKNLMKVTAQRGALIEEVPDLEIAPATTKRKKKED